MTPKLLRVWVTVGNKKDAEEVARYIRELLSKQGITSSVEVADEDILNKGHWTVPDYKQRMTTKEWKQILLSEQDKIIYNGRVVQLYAYNLGHGVVEVYKNIEG